MLDVIQLVHLNALLHYNDLKSLLGTTFVPQREVLVTEAKGLVHPTTLPHSGVILNGE